MAGVMAEKLLRVPAVRAVRDYRAQVRNPAKMSLRLAMKKFRHEFHARRAAVAQLPPFSTLCVPNQGTE